MRSSADRPRPRAAEAVAPSQYGNDGLIAHLSEAQARTRQIMREFNIGSAHISVMARQAENVISDTALRAEFLRVLIDLHEFGREARRRGLLDQAKRKDPAGPPPPDPEAGYDTRLFASSEDASDDVSVDASRALFAFLDR